MKKSLMVLSCVVLSGLVLMTGCKKSEEEQTEEAAKTGAADKSAQTEKALGSSDKQASGSEGSAAAEVDAGIPQYITDMVTHIKEINRLAKENIDNCAKAVELVSSYLENNQDKMKSFQKAAQEAQKSMSPDQQASFAQQVTRVMTPLMQETAKVQMEFTQKCQKEAQQISKIMNKVQGVPQD